jgi:two-component system sensor histidine kinase YesM
MNEETLRKLKDRLVGKNPDQSNNSNLLHSGLGVHNVDERIKLYFGTAYGLSYESSEEEGTTVRIQLPAIEGELEE